MKMENEITGLSTIEVNKRQELGQVNNYEQKVSKSTKEIIQDNVLTLFNLLNLIIAFFLAAVGAYSNLFFMVIIIINITIGITLEIRARNLVAQLSIVNQDLAIVIRNNEEQKIPSEELVLDDLVKLSAGDQVPTDMDILEGRVEVNEALLTGESDLIIKTTGDELFSGSFISSGSVYGKVVHVGKNNYATKIAEEAKIHKPITSELLSSVRKISKITSFIIVPLGIILFIEAFWLGRSGIQVAVVSSAAALLGMLPKGMVLLISIALATAVVKLGKKEVLVQDMYSVETLAHVDTLCLDKTGTITEGKMKIQDVLILSQTHQTIFTDIVGSYLKNSNDNNITMQAIRTHFKPSDFFHKTLDFPFSSERKWGAMVFEGLGTVALGAPERLFEEQELPNEILEAQQEGYRVLMLGISEQLMVNDNKLPHLSPLAMLVLDDPIRKNANATLSYLSQEGIEIKVISGDNPITVSNVARRAGLADYDSYIDLSRVNSDDEVRSLVNDYRVFGRVSPKQKKVLIKELKDQGHVVAMTGDGVNDMLALKEADCSIAMAEGDNATRQVANLILLNSDFTTLPAVLFEGRRVVNNVTKVASIFCIKTIYSFILSLLCVLTTITFPFVPIQITLLDLAIEGYPSFFLQFENDRRPIKTRFLPTALSRALPNALLVVFNVVSIYVLSQYYHWDFVTTNTLMFYMLIAVSSMAVIKACLPFNPLRLFLAISTTVGTYVAALLFKDILQLTLLPVNLLPLFLLLVLLTFVSKLILDRVLIKEKYRMKK